MARWLLDCQDSSNIPDAPRISQELLAGLLGAQRTTITALLKRFEQENLVRQFRGQVSIEHRTASRSEPANADARSARCALRPIPAPRSST